MSIQAIQKIEMELDNLTLGEKLLIVKKILNTVTIPAEKTVIKDFSKYRGIYKNRNIDVEKEVEEMREEWERIF